MVRVVFAAFATVIALSSCAAAEPVVTPPPSALETPSPTATPDADPADLSGWLISETGIGPLELGTTLADAAAAVPPLTRPADDACPYPEYLTLALPGGSSLDP